MLNDEIKTVENQIKEIETIVKETLENIANIKEDLDGQFTKLENLYSNHKFHMITIKRTQSREIRKLKEAIEDKNNNK